MPAGHNIAVRAVLVHGERCAGRVSSCLVESMYTGFFD